MMNKEKEMSDEKEFDPNEVEESEDDGTTRADGLDHEDEVVEK